MMTNINKKNNKRSDSQLFLLTKNAVPNILINVLKAKDLIEKENLNVAIATKNVGISRTTYYKYCNDVFYFDSAPKSKTIKIFILIADKVGVLSLITKTISRNKFNILTINQGQPVNNYSKITISIVMTDASCNLSNLIDELKKIKNIKEVKIESIEKE